MYSLRPYQKSAVDATIRHFQRSKDPALIVLPTGAGKSLVIAELARIAKGRVLVLAHVKELVEQNHGKYAGYGLDAGIYAAGLERKERDAKVIFGSIQSVARADAGFFKDFSLLVIDECHRVSMEGETQYAQVIAKLRAASPALCVLGLTATPYRLGLGWIYRYNHRGLVRTGEERFFKKCVYDVSLRTMINAGYLTPPIQIDAPVASYDFSSLKAKGAGGTFRLSDVESLLKDQGRVTPLIIANIVAMAAERKGVMIFTSSVRHAQEILGLLPEGEGCVVFGDTPGPDRDEVVRAFKAREIKYLVNVSVLTTGFDAPHVDMIAVLRPTESVSLYQQIVGRGLRLADGKTDCLVLDYTGQGHNVFRPEIADDKPADNAVPVTVVCPACAHENEFWGLVDGDGELLEHYGRKCRGATEDARSGAVVPCGFRFRFKRCDRCGEENDVAARQCGACKSVLVDDDKRLKEAMALKDAHVMRPDSMMFEKTQDKNGRDRLEVRYFDADGKHLTEYFYLNTPSDHRAFFYNFARMHLRLPERDVQVGSAEDAVARQHLFRIPAFVIARKKNYYWQVREKIFPD